MPTLTDFRLRVSAKLGLDNTSGSSEQLLVDSWINEAVCDVLQETRCYIAEATLSLPANQVDLTLDSSVLTINDIYSTSGGVNYQLERVPPDYILQARQGAVVAASPLKWYALNGANMIMLHPAPSGTDTITIYYVPRPTVMAAGANDPSQIAYGGIPSEWHKAIEFYALWQGGDYSDDETSQAGATYFQEYQAWIRRIRQQRDRRGGRRMGRIVPGRRTRSPVPHDNSTDSYYRG